MHRNDNFVNVVVLVVFYFYAGHSSVFQFITQPPSWCWGRCFPVRCNFFAATLYLLAAMHPRLQTGKRISRESSADLASWRFRRKLSRIVFGAGLWCSGRKQHGGNEMLFRIEMPGATELPCVWARASPRATPRASPRATPRASPRASPRVSPRVSYRV